MIHEFDFGPPGIIDLRFTGEVKEVHGCYSNLPEQVQDGLQLLCHAIIQLSPAVKKADAGVLWVDDSLVIINVGRAFILNNFGTGKAVLNLNQEKDGSYSTDYFSYRQMEIAGMVVDCAYRDLWINGRCA